MQVKKTVRHEILTTLRKHLSEIENDISVAKSKRKQLDFNLTVMKRKKTEIHKIINNLMTEAEKKP